MLSWNPRWTGTRNLAPGFEFLFRLTKVKKSTELFLDLFSSDIISLTVFIGPFSNLFFIDENIFLFYYVSIKKKQTKTTEASL